MRNKPSLNFMCMFYSTAFDLRSGNRLYRIQDCKVLGNELKDTTSLATSGVEWDNSIPIARESYVSRVMPNSACLLYLLYFVQFSVFLSLNIIHSLKHLSFPIKPKLAFILTSLLVRELKEIKILFWRVLTLQRMASGCSQTVQSCRHVDIVRQGNFGAKTESNPIA